MLRQKFPNSMPASDRQPELNLPNQTALETPRIRAACGGSQSAYGSKVHPDECQIDPVGHREQEQRHGTSPRLLLLRR